MLRRLWANQGGNWYLVTKFDTEKDNINEILKNEHPGYYKITGDGRVTHIGHGVRPLNFSGKCKNRR